MTREEAIKTLEYMRLLLVLPDRAEALDMAIAALREQGNCCKKGNSSWISVEDRLPEDGIRVLALHDDGVVRIGISRGYFPAVVSKTSTKTFGIAEVTHWMPLPEPPEVEG